MSLTKKVDAEGPIVLAELGASADSLGRSRQCEPREKGGSHVTAAGAAKGQPALNSEAMSLGEIEPGGQPDEALKRREDRAIERALSILEARAKKPGRKMSSVSLSGAFFRLRLGSEIREHFEVAFLDSQYTLLTVERLFSGTINGAYISPRIVVQRALALNSAAVILAHNHPSGNAEASSADLAITTQIKSVLDMVDVKLLDHLVVTADQALSMAGQGLL